MVKISRLVTWTGACSFYIHELHNFENCSNLFYLSQLYTFLESKRVLINMKKGGFREAMDWEG